MRFLDNTFTSKEKIFHFFNKLTDLVILNFLFIITSLPIITIGTSCTALYQTLLQLINNTESYIMHDYFSAWKANLKASTILWIPCMIFIILSAANLSILPLMPQSTKSIFLLPIQLLFLFLLYGLLLYSFVLPSPYRDTLKNTLRNALLISFRYLPFTVLCVCINALPFALIVLLPKLTSWIISLYLTIGFSLIPYIHSHILLHVLKKASLMTDNKNE